MIPYSRCGRAATTLLMSALACVVFSAGAQAQNNKLLVTGDAARRAVTNGDISGDAAARVAQGCVDFAAKNNFAAAVMVLDQTGNIVHSHRMDGIRPDEIESAMNKARAALFNRNATNTTAPASPRALDVLNVARGNLVRNFDPAPGGVAIILDNQMIGAIGVAGSDTMNADCARAGIAAVPGLTPPPAGAAPPAAPPAPAR